MKTESGIFLFPGYFFIIIAFVYGAVTKFDEMVGFPVLLLTAGLAFMVGVYFRMLAKRHGVRAEDREDAEIEELAGDQGLFAPWSWWPLVLAAGAALGFVALAVGWWIMVPATIVCVIGLVGWVMEYSFGRYSH